MKALQIILNCFVLIVISAPFISKTLFKRQALGYFGSWSPVLGLKKKKNPEKISCLECCTSERDVKNALTGCMSQVLPCCWSNIPRPMSTADTLEQRIFPNYTTWESFRYKKED